MTQVAFGRESRFLITGSVDRTVRLWDLRNAELPPRVFPSDGGEILSIVIDPTDRWLAIGERGESALLWDLSDPAKAPSRLPGYYGESRTVFGSSPLKISPDGRWLLSGRGKIKGHGAGPSPEFAPRLWNLTVDDPTKSMIKLSGQNGRVLTSRFSPDGRWLVVGSLDTAFVWDLNSEDPAGSLRTLILPQSSWVAGLAISPDGRWLISANLSEVPRLWDLTKDDPVDTGVKLGDATIGRVEFIEFSSDGSRAILGGPAFRDGL